MFLDNTACNLASINLMKFRTADGSFDVERFKAACRIYFIAQEILVDHASYPTADIARNSHLFRPLGLGYANLGSLLMSEGMPYDSEAGYSVCGSITALLHGTANLTSAEMAAVVGPFEGFHKNREPMLRVMQMHRDAVEKINDAGPKYLKDAARQLWDEVVALGKKVGYRNAQATVLAPTGTISFMMDCDTTGIEPDIALVKYKQLAGGGMLKIINSTAPLALQEARLRRSARSRRSSITSTSTTRSKAPRSFKRRAPARLRLCLQAGQRHPQHRLAGARPHDGRRPAVPLRGDQQDGQHAQRRRRRRTSPMRTSGAGSWASRPSPSIATAASRASRSTPSPKGTRPRRSEKVVIVTQAAARAAARYAELGDAQVQRRRARGLHQRRHVRPDRRAPASCSSRWPRKARPSAA